MQRSDVARKMEHIAALMVALSQDMQIVSGVDVAWHAKADEVSAAAAMLIEWAAEMRASPLHGSQSNPEANFPKLPVRQ